MGKLLNFVIKTSIYLTVFLVPFIWSPWAFELSKQYLFLFLVLIGLLAWLVRMVLVEREMHFKRTPLNLPLFLFAGAMLFSSLFSADWWSSLFGTYGRFSDGLSGIIAILGFYLLVTNTIQRPRSLVRPFLLSAALVVLLGYLSFFGVSQPLSGGFSIFLAFLVSFLALLSLRAEIKLFPFIGNLALMGAGLGLLFLLDAPKALLLLVAGLFLVLVSGLFQRALTGAPLRLKRLWILALLLLLTVVVLLSPSTIQEFKQEPARESMLSQKASFDIAFQSVTENGKNLFLGSGLGTFALDFSKHKPGELNETNQWQVRFDRAGSHIAQLLATTGILGLLSYLLVIFWFLVASLFFLKDKRNFPFVFGGILLFVAQALYSQDLGLQVLFWLFLALGVACFEVPKKEFRFSLKRFGEFDIVAKALLLLFVLAVGITFFFGARFLAAERIYLGSKDQQRSPLELRIDKTQRASQLNPWQAEYRISLSGLYLERVLSELQKPESQRNQEQISKDAQFAIAYTRGGVVGDRAIQGATELSPNKVASWQALGTVYQEITFAPGALEWGLRSFETAIALEPKNPVLYTELGKLYIVAEEFLQAREHLTKAKELKGDYLEPRMQLALLKEKEGDSQAALEQLQELGLQHPLGLDGNFQLGRLFYNQGEIPKAISQFKQVLRVAPNHSNALFALGVAFEAQGEIQKAIVQFEKALRLNPENLTLRQKLQDLQE